MAKSYMEEYDLDDNIEMIATDHEPLRCVLGAYQDDAPIVLKWRPTKNVKSAGYI